MAGFELGRWLRTIARNEHDAAPAFGMEKI
jgi:hypothetical protein